MTGMIPLHVDAAVDDYWWDQRVAAWTDAHTCQVCGGRDPSGSGECLRCTVADDTAARRRADQ